MKKDELRVNGSNDVTCCVFGAPGWSKSRIKRVRPGASMTQRSAFSKNLERRHPKGDESPELFLRSL